MGKKKIPIKMGWHKVYLIDVLSKYEFSSEFKEDLELGKLTSVSVQVNSYTRWKKASSTSPSEIQSVPADRGGLKWNCCGRSDFQS